MVKNEELKLAAFFFLLCSIFFFLIGALLFTGGKSGQFYGQYVVASSIIGMILSTLSLLLLFGRDFIVKDEEEKVPFLNQDLKND